MSSSILWQNGSHTVSIIDVPRSIVHAQGYSRPEDHELLSSPPLTSPRPTNEPKYILANNKLKHQPDDAELIAVYDELLNNALEEARKTWKSSWCFPRAFVTEGQVSGKKRKAGDELDIIVAHDECSIPRTTSSTRNAGHGAHLNSILASFAKGTSAVQLVPEHSQALTNEHPKPLEYETRYEHGFHNTSSDKAVTIRVAAPGGSRQATFNIPPDATFYMADCANANAFMIDCPPPGRQKQFDFILLDPPWPNRSVRRTHKTSNSTYFNSRTISDVKKLLLAMTLESIMADNAIIGMWITNKAAVRELILGKEGLFEEWGVELIEEWLWLKVTEHGKPVSPFDGVWRKPYEVLLLGRRAGIDSPDARVNAVEVQRRVLIGVPDLHSRKPCLKELIRSLVSESNGNRVLEVFARHLVSGWCSWGNECLKFNWDGYWREKQSTTD